MNRTLRHCALAGLVFCGGTFTSLAGESVVHRFGDWTVTITPRDSDTDSPPHTPAKSDSPAPAKVRKDRNPAPQGRVLIRPVSFEQPVPALSPDAAPAPAPQPAPESHDIVPQRTVTPDPVPSTTPIPLLDQPAALPYVNCDLPVITPPSRRTGSDSARRGAADGPVSRHLLFDSLSSIRVQRQSDIPARCHDGVSVQPDAAHRHSARFDECLSLRHELRLWIREWIHRSVLSLQLRIKDPPQPVERGANDRRRRWREFVTFGRRPPQKTVARFSAPAVAVHPAIERSAAAVEAGLFRRWKKSLTPDDRSVLQEVPRPHRHRPVRTS